MRKLAGMRATAPNSGAKHPASAAGLLALCHEFPPWGGGCGRNLARLCRELARRGARIEVWAGRGGTETFLPQPYAVQGIPVGRRGIFQTSAWGMLRFLWGGMLRARRAPSPPAAVLSAMAIPAGLLGACLAERWQVPHLVWHHGSDAHGGRPGGPPWFQKVLLRWVWRHSRRTFFVSASLRDLAGGFGRPPRPGLLPSCPEAPIEASESVSVGAAPDRFVFLGRYEAVKDPLTALRAYALLLDAYPEAPGFDFVGSGPLEAKLRAGARALGVGDRVRFLPPQTGEALAALYRSAWAVVLPSRMEGLNTTQLEAARQGTPSIAADVPGLRDFVKPGATGWLFPSGDAKALARVLAEVFSHPDERNRRGQAARRAAASFRIEAHADRLLLALLEDGVNLLPAASRHEVEA